MSAHNDGGPAFPGIALDGPHPPNGWVRAAESPGMSLRDWFAGQALSGLLADPEMNAPPEPVAKVAYSYADAMLAERAKAGKT